MTKGVGVNEEVFGETRGDLVKPGMTRADLDRLEQTVRGADESDPMWAMFNERSPGLGEGAPPRSRSRSAPRRAPLPDQREAYFADWK